MRVIPGSHSNGFSDYEDVDTPKKTFCRQFLPNAIDVSKAVYLELETNESSLYDVGLIHGAAANKINRLRCGFTNRYFSLNPMD